MNEKNKSYLSPQNILILVSLTGILLFFIVAPIVRIRIFDWIAMENNSIWAALDYFRHLYYSINRETCYGTAGDTVFSPLAYVIYHLIYLASSDTGTSVGHVRQMLSMPYQNIIFMIYSVIGMLLVIFDVELLNLSIKKKFAVIFCIFFSVPFLMGGLERGNLTVYCAAILVMAVLLSRSENKIYREIALLLIAFAAGLKIYVAAAGLVYLAEKRWKEAGRLITYGSVFFFLPFALLGGRDGFLRYLHTITAYTATTYTDRIEFIQGLLNYFHIVGNAASILSFLFLLILIALLLITKDDFRRMVFLAGMLAFVPGNAYRYALLYFLLPLFIFFLTNKDKKIESYIDGVLLGSIFTIPTLLGVATDFKLAYGVYAMTSVEVFIYIPAWALLFFNMIVELYYCASYYKNKNKTV